jgi:hypothetical protein
MTTVYEDFDQLVGGAKTTYVLVDADNVPVRSANVAGATMQTSVVASIDRKLRRMSADLTPNTYISPGSTRWMKVYETARRGDRSLRSIVVPPSEEPVPVNQLPEASAPASSSPDYLASLQMQILDLKNRVAALEAKN